MPQIFLAFKSRVQKTVRAGEGDVSAAASAQQRDDREYQIRELAHIGHAGHCLTHRRLTFERHVEHGDDHDAAQIFGQLIHAGLGVLRQENQNADGSGDDGSGRQRKAE